MPSKGVRADEHNVDFISEDGNLERDEVKKKEMGLTGPWRISKTPC